MNPSGQWRACSALFAFLLLLVGYRSSAAAVRPVDLCTLAAESSAIVQGRVARIVSGWTDPAARLIESEVVIRISESVRGGSAPGSLLTLRVRGGQVDALTMVASEEAAFTEGEQVLLFVTATPDGQFVTAGSQGKFRLAGEVAVQQSSQLAYRTTDLAAALQGAGRELRQNEGVCTLAPAVVTAPPAPRLPVGAATVNLAPEGYVYNGYKWFGPNPMEELYLINVNTGRAGGSNGSAAQFRDAIIAAGNAWTAVSSADFTFRYGGSSGVTKTGYDGLNVVHWENLGSGSTLAEATTWYSSGRIVETDIRFNDSQPWDATGAPASSEADLQSVALHELGHWLSLGHDNDALCSSCPATGPTMCSCYRMGSIKRTLAANDMAGIRALYPMKITNGARKLYLPLARRR